MNDALARIAGALPRLDRDTLAWGIVPAMSAAMVTALFALPNYARARSLRDESQRLQAESSERISQRNNLALLESNVARLREERDRRCRPLGDGAERDRLLAAITRTADGTQVRDQSIRTGTMQPVEIPGSDLRVMRRSVDVEMTASFDAIFGVIDAAEGADQLVTPRAIEITVLTTPTEQALQGNPAVRATLALDEWFEAPAPAAPAAAPNGGH
jgi:hypothetical protein